MISIPFWFAWVLLFGNFLSVIICLGKTFTTNYASRGVSRFTDLLGLIIGSSVLFTWIYFIFLRGGQ